MNNSEIDQKNYDRHKEILKKIQSSPKSFVGKIIELELINEVEYNFTAKVVAMIMAIEVKMYHIRLIIHPVKFQNDDDEFMIVHLHQDPQCYLWNREENKHRVVQIYC